MFSLPSMTSRLLAIPWPDVEELARREVDEKWQWHTLVKNAGQSLIKPAGQEHPPDPRTTHFRFFDLPRELRDRIYEQSLVTIGFKVSEERAEEKDEFLTGIFLENVAPRGLVFACRQTSSEIQESAAREKTLVVAGNSLRASRLVGGIGLGPPFDSSPWMRGVSKCRIYRQYHFLCSARCFRRRTGGSNFMHIPPWIKSVDVKIAWYMGAWEPEEEHGSSLELEIPDMIHGPECVDEWRSMIEWSRMRSLDLVEFASNQDLMRCSFSEASDVKICEAYDLDGCESSVKHTATWTGTDGWKAGRGVVKPSKGERPLQ